MKKTKKKSGFTLLEVIIVIIIIGVLASLALPRFFSTVEYSKASEALNNFSTLRQSLERCYLASGNTYVGCTIGTLDVANPSSAPNTHFTYTINNLAATTFTITATRSTFDGGTSGDQVVLSFNSGNTPAVTRSGTGSFSGIK